MHGNNVTISPLQNRKHDGQKHRLNSSEIKIDMHLTHFSLSKFNLQLYHKLLFITMLSIAHSGSERRSRIKVSIPVKLTDRN